MYVCRFVHVCFLKIERVNHPAVCSLGTLCEAKSCSYEWYPGQSSCLVKNVRKPSSIKTNNSSSLVVPGVRATETPDPTELSVTGSRHALWATMNCKWKPNYSGLQPEGLTKGSSSSTDVSPADVEKYRQQFVFPCIQQESPRPTWLKESTTYSLYCRKTRIAKYADAPKLLERHAEEFVTIGADRMKLAKVVAI